MLSPRWRKVLRDVWLHKSRTTLVVAAIVIGILGAGAVLDTWSLVRYATTDQFEASTPASATLFTDSIDDALLTRVRAIPAIADAQARRSVMGSARTRDGWRTAMLFATPDYTAYRIGKLKPEVGAWPPTDGGLFVESSSVTFAGAAIGDRMAVRIGDGPDIELAMPGFVRDVGVAPGWMEHLVYAFVTPATLQQLGAPSTMNELQVVVRDRSLDLDEVRRVAADVRAVVEASGRRVRDVNVPDPGQHIHAAQINSLLFTQGAFGLLALCLSGVLVVNLIAAMLTGQVREIGIMKSLGARTGQVAAMYLVLALGLGLVASAIAIPLAALAGRAYAEFTAELLNFDIDGAMIAPWVIVAQLAAGALLPVIAAAVPVLHGCRISVSEALRDLGIVPVSGATARWLTGARHISRPVLLSLRNVARRRQRVLLTLVTISVGGAVYLGSLNLRTAIIGAVDRMFEGSKFDMTLRLAEPQEPAAIEAAVHAVDGVAEAEAWSGTRATVLRADGSTGDSFTLTGLAVPSAVMQLRITNGRALQPGDRNVLVVSDRLREREPGLVVGARVQLLVAGRPAEWEVVGTAETGLSGSVYAPREAITRQLGDARVGAVVVAAKSRSVASHLDLVQRLRGALADAGMPLQVGQLVTQQRAVVEDHLVMVAGFLGSMSLLMIVVGGLGLASTMSLAVLERTREIGVMRAVGARHRAIIGIVQAEGLVIGLLSWVLAMPLSLPMSLVLGEAFGRVMTPVPMLFVPEMAGVLRWFAVVVVVSVVACAWPALRATRVPVARALAYE